MHVKNTDVENKICNGTVGFFRKCHLKENASLSKMTIDGFEVNCVEAKDVEYIEIEFEDKNNQGSGSGNYF